MTRGGEAGPNFRDVTFFIKMYLSIKIQNSVVYILHHTISLVYTSIHIRSKKIFRTQKITARRVREVLCLNGDNDA